MGAAINFIHESPIMREKLAMLERLANAGSTVLLLGEPGVGKEFAARWTHGVSPYSKEPFIHINCLEPDLESIAWDTGATLFFDEIGELLPYLQTELLEKLNKLNNSGENSTSVKRLIIASCKNDLEQLADEGRFSRDLCFKIGILPVVIPPLRERSEDIPLLAEHFLRVFALETKKKINGFSKAALEILCASFWNDNVRELKNCVERAVFLTKSDIIDEDALLIRSDFIYNIRNEEGAWDLKAAINTFKAAFVRRALEEHHWRKTLTASSLGIRRTYLSKLLTDLNIRREQ